MFKRLLIAVLLLALVGGGIVWFNMFRDRMIAEFFAGNTAPAVPVDTVVAETGQWVPALEAIGTVYANRGIELAVEAGGVVREINFEANDRVEAGQVLVRIADEIEQADLLAAEAQITLTRQAQTRVQSLGDRGIAAESSIEEAQANLSSARAQKQRIDAQIDQKVLVAPFAGEIGIPQIEAGQFVVVGAAVATLQDVDTLRVDFSLPEQNRPLIEIGQALRVSSETGAEATGFITAIEPRIDPATRLVSVRAQLDNRQGILSPGQFVRVRIALIPMEGIVALPQTAVVTSLYGDYVYTVGPAGEGGDGLVARQTFIKPGARQEGRVEIVEGVAEGDRIVIAGQNRLSNGQPVTLSGEAAAAAQPAPESAPAAPADSPAEAAPPAEATPADTPGEAAPAESPGDAPAPVATGEERGAVNAEPGSAQAAR